MKKSLSLLIALAMVFGMFASMASAATNDLTTAQKYQWFVDQGVLKGDPSGNPRLDSTLTRAEFATINASVGGLKLISSTSSFSDVKVKDWYFSAIQSNSDAGLVNGIGAGKFGPKLNVTVEQVIKVAVALANIKPVDGAVVAGSSAWAGPYIQAAINAGLSIPSNYKANATRGQTVDLAYAVYQLKALPVLSDVAATVNADDTITVSGKVVGKADSVKVALGTATAVAATLKDDKTFTYTTAKQSAGTYKLTVVAYDGTKSSVAVEKEVTIGGFTVVSATQVNSKQVAIKFNKPVQEGVSVGGATYALNNAASSNVLLNNIAPIAGSVSDDKTTVTYTFLNGNVPFANNAYAQLEVKSGLKSATGQSVAGYKTAILLNDTAKPEVTGVTYSGKTATIAFSESIPTLGTLSVNGASISAGTSTTVTSSVYYVANPDTTDSLGWTKSVTVYNLTPGTNYSFYLIGGADYYGNRFDYNTTLNVPSDTTPPTIVSLTTSGSTITVKFSEPVSTAGSVYNTSSATTGTPASTLSGDGLTATYNVSWVSGTFLNTTVVVKGYKDLVGNVGADFSQAVSLSLDTTKPDVAGVAYDGTNLYIKYNEVVAVNTVAGTIKFDYTNTNRVLFANQTWNFSNAALGYDLNNDGDYNDDGENLYIRIPLSGLAAGTYALTDIPKDLAKDTSGNTSNKGTASFTVAGGSTGGTVSLLNVTKPSNNKLLLEFNSALDPDSALNVSKYTINDIAIPTDSKLSFVGSQKFVEITLPAGSIPVTGERIVKVSNVVDTAGNTLSSANSKPVTLVENVAPIAQKVEVISDTRIAVTFSETLKASSLSTTGIEVYINNSTSKTAVTASSISNNVLYLDAAGTNVAGTFSNSQAIQVKFAGAAVTDMSDNAAADVTINK